MEKVINDVYTYLNVRNLIQNDFWQRSERNSSFSLRSYANMLSVSPGFLSQYLGGKKNISKERLKPLLENIGLENDEIEYAISLSEVEKYSSKHEIPESLKDKVVSKYIFPKMKKTSAYSALLDSEYHYLISALATREGSSKEDLFVEFSKLKNDRALFDQSLQELLKDNALIEENGLIKSKDNIIITESNVRVMKQNRSLSNLVHEKIIDHGEYDDEHISNGLSIKLKKEQIPLARKVTVKALHDLMRMNQESRSKEDEFSIFIYTQEYTVLD